MNDFIEKALSFGYEVKTINDKLIEMKYENDVVYVIINEHTNFKELSDKLQKK